MSVLIVTSCGNIVIDLFIDECPIACNNFLKLCTIKYYNNNLFFNIQHDYIAQTGDPTGTGHGGNSIYGYLKNERRSFQNEVFKNKKHNKIGLVSMANDGKENSNYSQFFITLRGENMDHLDMKHTIFGEIAEGEEILQILNELYCDKEGRPYQDVRIRHTYILEDPFTDPIINFPPDSPKSLVPMLEKVKARIPYENGIDAPNEQKMEEIEDSMRRKEAVSRAVVLEMTGDLPSADAKPPSEVLFVCKLNSVTTSEDLELIFSRFGSITSCEVIRDIKTADSLCYAFIGFERESSCIEAYNKMNNVLIDDRRIKVDFSQSVAHLWNRYKMQSRKGQQQKQSSQATRPQQIQKHQYNNNMSYRLDRKRYRDSSSSPSDDSKDHRKKSKKKSKQKKEKKGKKEKKKKKR